LNTAVREVQALGDRVTIRLEDGTEIEAGSAVVAPGPWIRELVPELHKRLKLTRQPLLWFSPVDADLVRPDRMPVFFLQSSDDLTYGLPDICGNGVKAASHLSGGGLLFPGEPGGGGAGYEGGGLSRVRAGCSPAC